MKKTIKQFLCTLFFLAFLMGSFSSCTYTDYTIYTSELLYSGDFIYSTPLDSYTYFMDYYEETYSEKSTKDVSLYSHFSWNGERFYGRYTSTNTIYQKGFLGLKEKVLYDEYSGLEYSFKVERKSQTLRSCQALTTDTQHDFDVGAEERIALLEQAVSLLEQHVPERMRSAFVCEIDPDGYTLSYNARPDLGFFLIQMNLHLFPDGSLKSFHSYGLESLPALSSTSLELLQSDYRRLSSEQTVQSAIERRLDWLFQLPVEETLYPRLISDRYPELAALKDKEKHLAFESSEWRFSTLLASDQKAIQPLRIELAPSGRLCLRAYVYVIVELTTKDGTLITEARSVDFFITPS